MSILSKKTRMRKQLRYPWFIDGKVLSINPDLPFPASATRVQVMLLDLCN